MRHRNMRPALDLPQESTPAVDPVGRRQMKRKQSGMLALVPSGGPKWRGGIRAAADVARQWLETRDGGDFSAIMSKQVIDVFIRGQPYQNAAGCKLAIKADSANVHTQVRGTRALTPCKELAATRQGLSTPVLTTRTAA